MSVTADNPPAVALTASLDAWIVNPVFQAYMGRSVAMKMEVFAAVVNGVDNWAEIARRYGVSKQAGHAMATRARKVLVNL